MNGNPGWHDGAVNKNVVRSFREVILGHILAGAL